MSGTISDVDVALGIVVGIAVGVAVGFASGMLLSTHPADIATIKKTPVTWRFSSYKYLFFFNQI